MLKSKSSKRRQLSVITLLSWCEEYLRLSQHWLKCGFFIKDASHSDKPTENYHQLFSSTEPIGLSWTFSLLFWFSGPQLRSPSTVFPAAAGSCFQKKKKSPDKLMVQYLPSTKQQSTDFVLNFTYFQGSTCEELKLQQHLYYKGQLYC